MKKYITRRCISLALLLTVVSAMYAENKKEANNQIVICGQADSAIAVHIAVFPELFINDGTYLSNQIINLKEEKNFSFRFRALKEPVYIRVVFSYRKKSALQLESYILEAGDSLFIQATGN